MLESKLSAPSKLGPDEIRVWVLFSGKTLALQAVSKVSTPSRLSLDASRVWTLFFSSTRRSRCKQNPKCLPLPARLSIIDDQPIFVGIYVGLRVFRSAKSKVIFHRCFFKKRGTQGFPREEAGPPPDFSGRRLCSLLALYQVKYKSFML